MKILKRMGLVLAGIPALAIAAFVLFQLAGAAVNHAATAMQTARLEKDLLARLSDARVIRTYSETGNTSGTGNHVDMLSIALFKTEESEAAIYAKMQPCYDFSDGGACWLAPATAVLREHREKPYAFPFLDRMEVPEDPDGCYIFYLNKSAPFADNIEGH